MNNKQIEMQETIMLACHPGLSLDEIKSKELENDICLISSRERRIINEKREWVVLS